MFLSIRCSCLKHFMMENVLKPNKSRENCIRTPHCPSLVMINCWLALFICFPASLYSSLNFVCSFYFLACRILVPRPEIKPTPHPLERWNFNHWTTGEGLPWIILILYYSKCNFVEYPVGFFFLQWKTVALIVMCLLLLSSCPWVEHIVEHRERSCRSWS